MAMQSANELFLRELVDLRDVEQTILQMMPQEIGECSNEVQVSNAAIAAYGDLVEQAKVIDEPEVVRLLQENLSQEEAIGRQAKQLSRQLRKRWAEQPVGSSRERR